MATSHLQGGRTPQKKDEEERRACAHEEECKFEKEQMQMKLEFERKLKET